MKVLSVIECAVKSCDIYLLILHNIYTGLILGLCSANERRPYKVTLSLAGRKPRISPVYIYIYIKNKKVNICRKHAQNMAKGDGASSVEKLWQKHAPVVVD